MCVSKIKTVLSETCLLIYLHITNTHAFHKEIFPTLKPNEAVKIRL